MTDQAEDKKPLTQLAAEYFGDEYKGPDAPAPKPMGKALTVDEAIEIRQEARDMAAIQEQQAQVAPSKPVADAENDEDEPVPQSEALWSGDDVHLFNRLEKDVAQYQYDFDMFQKLKAAGVDELAKGDKDKARAIRLQFADAEKEFGVRSAAIASLANQLSGKAQNAATDKTKKALAQEKDKVLKAFPDFDHVKLSGYLAKMKFPKHEVAEIADHRLVVLAEKARRYDEIQSTSPSQKVNLVPKYRKGAKPGQQPKQNTEIDKARAKLKQTGSIYDAVALQSLMKRSRA